jgi:large conductance mechanosensitive channel
MLKEFKAFILRGNVVELAVAVVIGAAFGRIVTALVEGILTPLLAIPGETNFGELDFAIGGGVFRYGDVINAIISFLSIAAAVFFLVVRPLNSLMARHKTEPEVESTTKDCAHCLSSIPAGATVCAFCTRDVAA